MDELRPGSLWEAGGGGVWWSELAALATGHLQPQTREPQSRLLDDVERHLLLALLTPRQVESVRAHGWFDVPWPEQCLLLRIHVDRIPTVDAYGAQRGRVAEYGLRGGRAVAGATAEDWTPAAYLCSWEVGRVRRSVDHKVEFVGTVTTPTGLARRVWEARRRGAHRKLLEAAEVVNLVR